MRTNELKRIAEEKIKEILKNHGIKEVYKVKHI